MPLQNFVSKNLPQVSAAWLNSVDALLFTIFGTPATKSAARTALTSDVPLEVANGGTATRTPNASAWTNAPTYTGTVTGAALVSSAGPNALAGDTVARGVAICKFKAATTTRSVNPPTLANDPDLVYAIPGAGTYSFRLAVQPYGVNTSFQFNINYSGTFTAGASSYYSPASGGGAAVQATVTGSPVGYATTNVQGAQVAIYEGVLVATGAGNLAYAWGAVTNGTATNLGQGSYLLVTQLS